MSAPVAVAVVSWNTRDLLDRCLRSLRPEHEAGRADVWVVDNGSRDGSPELVAEQHRWATLLQPGENVGFGPAVNLVAERTASPWLASANADVELEPGALEALLAAGAAHDRAGALAPRLVDAEGRAEPSVQPLPTLPVTIAFNLGLYRVVPGLGDRLGLPGRWDPERARVVGWALGAFQLMRREAFDAAGGFDSAQWLYAEDVELGRRLAAAGWHTRYVPHAVVRHHGAAATTAAFGGERDARWMAATYAWQERRRGGLRTRAVAGLNVAGASARWALVRLRGGDPGARATLAGWARLHQETGLAPRRKLEDHH